jgi:hypothetical protein
MRVEGPERQTRHRAVLTCQPRPIWRGEAPDDIFIVGDTHQRIYENPVSLRDVGINIAGRSSRLNINYRTTAEILGWSLGLLRREPTDDMERGLESIAGCNFLRARATAGTEWTPQYRRRGQVHRLVREGME